MPKPGNSPNVSKPALSLPAGLAIAGKNTSPQTSLSSQNTMDANRLAKVPNRPSEGVAPMGNKLPPLPLP
jgi:hypothetical protein